MIGSTEPINSKNFVMVGVWQRLELGTNCVVNKITETLVSMGFGVEVRKLHV